MTSPSNVSPLLRTNVADRHVFVRGLRLDAEIGVHDHEHGRTQPIIIGIDLAVSEAAAPREDALGSVVCYEAVVTKVMELVSRGHVKLVETLAEDIAAMCLADTRVLEATVQVEKPDAIEAADSVGISLTRTRR